MAPPPLSRANGAQRVPLSGYTVQAYAIDLKATVMSHTIRDKTRLIARTRRIRGQVEALERALDAEKGCAEVLHQIAAIRGAVQGLMAEVMEGHIREHLAGRDAASQATRTQAADELVAVLRTYFR